MNFPNNVKYTSEHEWIRVEGDVRIVLGKVIQGVRRRGVTDLVSPPPEAELDIPGASHVKGSDFQIRQGGSHSHKHGKSNK